MLTKINTAPGLNATPSAPVCRAVPRDQTDPFLQNKANFKKVKIRLTHYTKSTYDRLDTWCDGTKQTQTKPIATRPPRSPPVGSTSGLSTRDLLYLVADWRSSTGQLVRARGRYEKTTTFTRYRRLAQAHKGRRHRTRHLRQAHRPFRLRPERTGRIRRISLRRYARFCESWQASFAFFDPGDCFAPDQQAELWPACPAGALTGVKDCDG